MCRAAVGRPAAAADRIGSGRNSRVFRVVLAGGADGPSPVVVKFYRRDPGDARDRLATEFGALQFLWRHGVRAIPRPIAADHVRYGAVYDYIAGVAPAAGTATADDVDAAVRFLAELQPLRTRPDAAALSDASEACFSLAAIAVSVKRRLARLRGGGPGGDGPRLQAWLDRTFEPLMREVLAWGEAAAARARIAFDDDLPFERRVLSPSDFGFHNAIRRPDGSLAFVDFEYFGWDDPAKTLADFVLHPGMMLAGDLQRRFADGWLAAFPDAAGLADRAQIACPMFGLKWCLILLNVFLPDPIPPPRDDETAPDRARAIRVAQLAKADAMAGRIAREYRGAPWANRP